MTPEEKWILFLEKNPAFFALCKNALALRILEKLGDGPKSAKAIKEIFSGERDRAIRLALNALVEAKAAAVVRLEAKDIYVITPAAGKELSSLYGKAGRFFIAK